LTHAPPSVDESQRLEDDRLRVLWPPRSHCHLRHHPRRQQPRSILHGRRAYLPAQPLPLQVRLPTAPPFFILPQILSLSFFVCMSVFVWSLAAPHAPAAPTALGATAACFAGHADAARASPRFAAEFRSFRCPTSSVFSRCFVKRSSQFHYPLFHNDVMRMQFVFMWGRSKFLDKPRISWICIQLWPARKSSKSCRSTMKLRASREIMRGLPDGGSMQDTGATAALCPLDLDAPAAITTA
jgi:hypothetical protein